MSRGAGLPAQQWAMLAALAAICALAWQQHSGGALVALDLWLAHALHAGDSPGLVTVMRIVSLWHNTLGLLLMAALLAGMLAWHGRSRDAVFAAVAVAGGMLLNVALKLLFQRARPVFEEPLVTLASYSFPSGHAAGGTVLYGALVVLAWPAAGRWRGALALAAAVMVGWVCLSRLLLGAHFLIDVLAGVLVGLLWLGLCHALMRPSSLEPAAGRR